MAHNEALKCNAQQQRPQTTITNAALHLPLLTEAFLWVYRESIWWPARVNQRKRKRVSIWPSVGMLYCAVAYAN